MITLVVRLMRWVWASLMATTQELAPAVAPMSISFMARYGEALIDAGYRILPIQPGTKKPGMMRNGQWFDYPQ